MTSSYEHAFRYETSLCSLAEDETFDRRRTAEAEPATRRSSLRARLGLGRAAGRRRITR